ncbi:hypothetical protein [Porphyrobacter sp. CACIAM 03H1]|uniref:hypothetical protein n=1 Tax=Porphyrobacter sp. CACIAM 03H1 TaxID=2003315 RepID=UPI000B5A8EFB|nr:hypothetical protein [Porphyrobacter sp. CACIAM 03H1]ASJ92348.1 hypothetical protein CBR61_16455 [Porphyrobacter sp. CACIAM 03H1]
MLPYRHFAPIAVAAAALALPGCATTPYTGPVEVTRFVAPSPAGLGQGTIAPTFPEEVSNEAARRAFAAAIGVELARLGYTVVAEGAPAAQVAAIRTSRQPIAAAPVDRRGPVNVGVGGTAGSFGSGLGMGVGINLGGGREGPAATTTLEVRIGTAAGTTLWEGRAQMETGVKSPYSQVETSARTLAAGLFRGFPGGNGETVTIDAKKLQGTK